MEFRACGVAIKVLHISGANSAGADGSDVECPSVEGSGVEYPGVYGSDVECPVNSAGVDGSGDLHARKEQRN